MQETVQYYAASVLASMLILGATVYGTFYTLSPGADARTKMTLFLYDVSSIYERISFTKDPSIVEYTNPDFTTDLETGLITYQKNSITLIKRRPIIRSDTASKGVGHVNYELWVLEYIDENGNPKQPVSIKALANNLAPSTGEVIMNPTTGDCKNKPNTLCDGKVEISNVETNNLETAQTNPLEDLLNNLLIFSKSQDTKTTNVIRMLPQYKLEGSGTQLCLQRRVETPTKPNDCYGDGKDYYTKTNGENRNWRFDDYDSNKIVERKTSELISCCGINEELTTQCHQINVDSGNNQNKKCGCYDRDNSKTVEDDECSPTGLLDYKSEVLTAYSDTGGKIEDKYLPIPNFESTGKCLDLRTSIEYPSNLTAQGVTECKTLFSGTPIEDKYCYTTEICYDLKNLGYRNVNIKTNGYGDFTSKDGVLSSPQSQNTFYNGQSVPASTTTIALYYAEKNADKDLTLRISYSPSYYYSAVGGGETTYKTCSQLLYTNQVKKTGYDYTSKYKLDETKPCKNVLTYTISDGDIMIPLEYGTNCYYAETNTQVCIMRLNT